MIQYPALQQTTADCERQSTFYCVIINGVLVLWGDTNRTPKQITNRQFELHITKYTLDAFSFWLNHSYWWSFWKVCAVNSGFTVVYLLKAGISIMTAFPHSDLVSALSVCQLALLKRLKQSGSLPCIKAGWEGDETRVEEGWERCDLSTSSEVFLAKQPFRNEQNDRLASVAPQREMGRESIHDFPQDLLVFSLIRQIFSFLFKLKMQSSCFWNTMFQRLEALLFKE